MKEVRANKFFCVDIETTGLETLRNEILTLSMSVCDKNGELDSIDIKMRPETSYWSTESEGIHGISRFEASRFPSQEDGAKRLIEFMTPHTDAILVFHAAFMFNAYFDLSFLNSFLNKFCRHNEMYRRTLLRTSTITWLRWLDRNGIEKNDDFKLKSLCYKYGIELNHHDAKSDRLACQKLFYIVLDRLKQVEFGPNGMEGLIYEGVLP